MERKSWKLIALIVMAAVMIFAAAGLAAAEGEADTGLEEVWKHERMINKMIKHETRATVDPNVVVLEQIKAPALGDTAIWSVVCHGPDNLPVREVVAELMMKDFDSDYSMVYRWDILQEADSCTLESCEFVTGGEYEFDVFVTFEDGSVYGVDYCNYVEFTIADDAAHTSLTEKVSQIVNDARDNSNSTWELALNLHDWLTNNAYYEIKEAGSTNFHYYGADGVLLRGYGVCDSYSKAYLMLCREAGITVSRVIGNAGGPHSWNAIQLDGLWYLVDVTWDDPSGIAMPVSGSEGHDYFCLNDELMGLDHVNDGEEFAEGQCNSLAANYYVRAGEDAWDQVGDKYFDENEGIKRYSTDILEQMNANETTFQINCQDKYYVKAEQTETGGYSLRTYNVPTTLTTRRWKLLAASMSRTPFTLTDDTVRYVTVNYDKTNNRFECEVQSDFLSIGNTQNKTTFETGEEFSFIARYITSDATGITLQAEITKEGETEATDTQTTDTNMGEFEFRLWETGDYSLTISAYMNGEILTAQEIELSVEAPHGYLNVDPTIPQYWPVPPAGSLYRLTLDYENADVVPDTVDVRIYPYYGDELIGEWIGITPGTVIEFPIAAHNLYSVECTQYKQGYRKTTRYTSRCMAVTGQLNAPTLTLPTGTIYAGEPVSVTVNGVENADYYKLKISGPEYDDEWEGYTTKHVSQAGEYLLEQYGLDGGTYTITLTAGAEYDYMPSVSDEYTLTVSGERHPAPTVNAPEGTFTVDDTAWFTITGEGMTAAARNGYNDTTYQAQNGTAMIPIEVYRYTYASFRGMFNGRWSEATDEYSIRGNPKEEPERPAGPVLTFNPTAPKQGEDLRVGVTPVDSEQAVQYAISFGQKITETGGDFEYSYMDQIIYDMPFDISEGGVLIEGCNLFEPGTYMVTVTVYSDLYGGWLCETTQEVTVGENPNLPAAPTARLLTEENLLFGKSRFEITTGGGADRIYAFISIKDVPGVEENPREIAISTNQTKYTMEWTGLRAGTYVAYFVASRNGVWSETSEPLEFEVTTEQEKPVETGELYYPTEIAIGEPLIIRWDAVNGVEWYEADAYTDSDVLYDGRIEKGVTSLTIDTSVAEHSGSVWVRVRPYVPGYYHNDLYTKEDIRLLDPMLKITATVTRAEDTANIVHLHLTNVQANRVLVRIDGVLTGMYGLGQTNGTADLTIAVPSRTSQIQVANYDTDPRKWGTWSDPVTANDITLDPTKTLYLPEDLTEIQANAFEGIAAEAVIIPDGCTTIGAGAFRSCPNLMYVSYKQGTTIGEGAFDRCPTGLQFNVR